MKRVNGKLLLLFSVLFFLVLGFFQVVQADSAQLYLSPSSGSFLVGSTFTVSVFINTEGNEINVIQTELKFPPNILQITSPTAGTSLIAEWLTPPSYSNERGTISYQGAIPGGITTSAGLVSSITFRAVTSGTAKIEFAEPSKVILNDARGINILTSTINGKYQILIPPPEGPEVFSPTHPNPSVWYSDSSSAFSWEKEEGVTDFSWSFDQNPIKRPDGISEGSETQASFSDLSDGIWYFHLRQKKQGVWGKTSHVQIRVDTNPPKKFKPEIKSYNRLISYQTLIYFETTDDYSGVDHYKVGLIDLNTPEPARAFLTEETSPYKVPFKKPGKYNVIIKAVDKAGNIGEEEIRFRLMTPLITHIEGRGLEIRGTLFPWWLVWILTFVLLGGAGVLIWWLRKIIIRKIIHNSQIKEKRKPF
jgi:hypothetical protein